MAKKGSGHNDKSDRAVLNIRRTVCYIVLVILTIICLFSFYILVINASRSHPEIQKGFSAMPGKSLRINFNSLMNNDNLPVLRGILNSLLVSGGCAVLTTYFSALTAYAIHAYNFRFRKAAFYFILMIMMVPTQVTALGFVRQMNAMKLMDSFIPLIVPSIAAPTVFFFMKQYMDCLLYTSPSPRD